jgi:hypothetical protein
MINQYIRSGVWKAAVGATFGILLLNGCGGSQKGAVAMKDMVPTEIRGWSKQGEPETYDRQTIFDYIDGAGEVYLSYGFKQVMVFRYAKSDAPEIIVEIFNMGSPEDAYGVFSHSREKEELGIGMGYEYQGSLLSFWKSAFFVCVLADQETPVAKEAVFALARTIDARIAPEGGRPRIVEVLPQDSLVANSVRFFHTYASLNYHYFLAEENILNLDTTTAAVIAQYRPGSAYLVCIKYPSADQAAAGYASFMEKYLPEGRETGIAQIEQGNWTGARVSGAYLIIALDAATEEDALQMIDDCARKISEVKP